MKTLKGEGDDMHGNILMRDVRPPSISDIMDDLEIEAPKIRADCINGPRPCPWVRCKWHAIWALKASHSLLLAHYTDEQIIKMISEMRHSCTLDVCDMGGVTLDLVGDVLHTTRERVRQIEECDKVAKDGTRYRAGALASLRKPRARRMLRLFQGEG